MKKHSQRRFHYCGGCWPQLTDHLEKYLDGYSVRGKFNKLNDAVEHLTEYLRTYMYESS